MYNYGGCVLLAHEIELAYYHQSQVHPHVLTLSHPHRRIKKWHDLAGKASLTKEQTQQLQAIVTTKFSVSTMTIPTLFPVLKVWDILSGIFQEWLDMTGHSSEIDDLEKGSQSYREGDSKEK